MILKVLVGRAVSIVPISVGRPVSLLRPGWSLMYLYDIWGRFPVNVFEAFMMYFSGTVDPLRSIGQPRYGLLKKVG